MMRTLLKFVASTLVTLNLSACFWQDVNSQQVSIDFSADPVSQAVLTREHSRLTRALVSDAYPSLKSIELSITSVSYDSKSINDDFNAGRFSLSDDGQAIVVTDTLLLLNVPMDEALQFEIRAVNQQGYQVYRAASTLDLRQVEENAQVELSVAMQVDIDTEIPVLSAVNDCVDTGTGSGGSGRSDGYCDVFEDVFFNALGVADIDGDGLLNSIDDDADGDGVLDWLDFNPLVQDDSGQVILPTPSNNGYPMFIHPNTVPEVADVTISTTEGVTVNLLLPPQQVDSDVNDAVTYRIATSPLHGRVSVTELGAIEYVPDPYYVGEDSFSVFISDLAFEQGADTSLYQPTTFTMNMLADPALSNLPPVFVSSPITSTLEDALYQYSIVANDPDGTPTLSATLSDGSPLPSWLNFDGTSLSGTPSQADVGSYNLSIKASEGGDVVEQAFTLTVVNVNDLPVVNAHNLTVGEESLASVLGIPAPVDEEGDTLSIKITSLPGQGAVHKADFSALVVDQILSLSEFTSLIYDAPTEIASDTAFGFDYEVSDGQGGVALGSVSITVQAINDAPQVSSVSLSVDEEAVAPLLLSVPTDPEQALADLVITVGDLPTLGTVTLQEGSPVSAGQGLTSLELAGLLYKAPMELTAIASDSFSYSVSDGIAAAVVGTAAINLNPVNDAPVVSAHNLTVGEESLASVLGIPAPVDEEGDTLSIKITSLPAQGTLHQADFSAVARNQVLSLTEFMTLIYDAPTEIASDTAFGFDYEVSDGQGGVTLGSVSITVQAINDAPQVSSVSLSVDEEAVVPLLLSVPSDPEQALADLVITVEGLPEPGTVTLADSSPVAVAQLLTSAQLTSLLYEAPLVLGAATSTSFSYSVNDGIAAAVTGTATFNLNPVNDAPVAAADSFVILEDTATLLDVLANDSDEDSTLDASSVVLINGPSSGTLSGLTYTPNANFNGSDTFSYRLNDGGSFSAEVVASITVTPVNDAPTISGFGTATVDENQTSALAVSASDVEGDTLTYLLSGSDAEFFTVDSSGVVTFNIAPDFEVPVDNNFDNIYELSITVSDDGTPVEFSTQTLAITIQNVNEAPQFPVIATQSASQDSEFRFTAAATDDTADLTYSWLAQPSWLSLNSTTGEISGTPTNASVLSPNTVSLQGSDGEFVDTVSFNITVDNINDAPIASSDGTIEAVPGAHLRIDVLANDSDPDVDLGLDTLKITSVTADSGKAWLPAEGNYIFFLADADSATGPINLSYVVSDQGGLSSGASLTVNINTDADGDGLSPDVIVFGANSIDSNDSVADSDADTFSDLANDVGAAPTVVSADITTDTVWDLKGSPYEISTAINVSSGAQLIIEQGVSVKFLGGTAGLTVSDTSSVYTLGGTTAWLNVELTSQYDSKEQFTLGSSPAAAAGDWSGLVFNSSSVSRLTGTSILFATQSLTQSSGDMGLMLSLAANQVDTKPVYELSGASSILEMQESHLWGGTYGLAVTDAMAVINESTISGAASAGLWLDSNQIQTITNNIFQGNVVGINLANHADGQRIFNNLFHHNLGGLTGYGAAIYAGDLSGDLLSVENNIFFANEADEQGGAIAVGSSAVVDILGNTFDYNTAWGETISSADGGAIYVLGGTGNVRIRDNVFNDNATMCDGRCDGRDIDDVSSGSAFTVDSAYNSSTSTGPLYLLIDVDATNNSGFDANWYLPQAGDTRIDSGSVTSSTLPGEHYLLDFGSPTTDYAAGSLDLDDVTAGSLDLGYHHDQKGVDIDMVTIGSSTLSMVEGIPANTWISLENSGGIPIGRFPKIDVHLDEASSILWYGDYSIVPHYMGHGQIQLYVAQTAGCYSGYTDMLNVIINGISFGTITLNLTNVGAC